MASGRVQLNVHYFTSTANGEIMFKRFTTIASTLTVAAGVVATAVATAGAANATRADDEFLSDLTGLGLVISDPAQAITNAHLICDALADGGSFSRVEAKLASVEPAMTTTDVTNYVNSAVWVYCPEQFAAPE